MKVNPMVFSISCCFLGCCDMATSTSPGDTNDRPDANSRINHIAFVGNSYHDEGIDFSSLRSDLGCTIEHHWTGGVMSAWKYAKIRNMSKGDTVPEMVFISTDMNTIMLPAIRTTGKYWDSIIEAAEGDSEILNSIKSIIEQDHLILDRWDLQTYVSKTFLPPILDACEDMGSVLVVARMRTRIEARDPFRENQRHKEFREALATYLSDREIIYLDYSQDPEIGEHDFFDDHHLNGWGRNKWTRMIKEDLLSLIHNQTPFHHFTGRNDDPACKIDLPDIAGVLKAGKQIRLGKSCDGAAKWSICHPDLQTGELYLGSGSDLNAKITPAVDSGVTAAKVCAYTRGIKFCAECSVICEKGNNMPPLVNAGPDTISYLGQALQLHGTIEDEVKSDDSLEIRWEIIRGNAGIDEDTTLCPTIKPEKTGLLVVALVVHDGEYQSRDLISVSVNATKKFLIQSPFSGESYSVGDTLHIRWEAPGINDCVITATFDRGISFHDLSNATIPAGDPRWGHFTWIIPESTPVTDCARIRLHAYDGTATGISDCFSIQ